jgi:hypothetical protein
MQKIITTISFLLLISGSYAQQQFSKREISINGFRNPSIGAEFRANHVSVHAGYYPTVFKAGENTSFFKAGISYWFLPAGKKENPSSFFAGIDYLRGFSRDYKDKNALGMEAGYRWMITRNLNFRIGVIAVAAKGESLKINPAPGISYSFFIR